MKDSFLPVINSSPVGSAAKSQVYYNGLDSIRAICFFVVLVEHWFTIEVLAPFNFGIMALNFFFVISGFLITEILVKNRYSVELKTTTYGKALKLFYIRRSLRIFPLYFAVIGVLLYFNIGVIRPKAIYYLTYTTNFWSFNNQEWVSFGHLWSLCVEEQFYLVWPFIILFTPKRFLIYVISAFFFIGPLFREITYYTTHNAFTFQFPLSAFDGFALGALVAWFYQFKRENGYAPFKESVFNKIGWVSLIVYLCCVAHKYAFNKDMPVLGWLYISSIFGIACALVKKCADGFTGWIKIIIDNKVLLFVGKITYSLYVFHMIINVAIPDAIQFYGWGKLPFEGSNKLIYVFILFAMSISSWFLFEKQVLKLKQFFEYRFAGSPTFKNLPIDVPKTIPQPLNLKV